MNEYEKKIERLNIYRNKYYTSTDKEQLDIFNALDDFLPLASKEHELLELYKTKSDLEYKMGCLNTTVQLSKYKLNEKDNKLLCDYAYICEKIQELENSK